MGGAIRVPIDKKHKVLNTLQLRDLDFCSPARVVQSLRDKGFHIQTELKTAFSKTGRRHKNVAHYFIGGGDYE